MLTLGQKSEAERWVFERWHIEVIASACSPFIIDRAFALLFMLKNSTIRRCRRRLYPAIGHQTKDGP